MTIGGTDGWGVTQWVHTVLSLLLDTFHMNTDSQYWPCLLLFTLISIRIMVMIDWEDFWPNWMIIHRKNINFGISIKKCVKILLKTCKCSVINGHQNSAQLKEGSDKDVHYHHICLFRQQKSYPLQYEIVKTSMS